MCLYPRKLRNKKYTATEKNKGVIPDLPITGETWYAPIYDTRVLEIEVPCGQCIECRQAKAREWQVRLGEEIKDYKHKYFVTLTFGPKELEEVCKKSRLSECNALAAYALRHSLERWRKDEKKSLRHWFITELGHEGTERIHMHGLIFTDKELDLEVIEEIPQKGYMCKWKYWKYGLIFVGLYVNQRTINYISKYITKIDTDHKGFIGNILASPGIGRSFVDRQEGRDTYKYRPRKTVDFYELPNGSKVKLPKYYANKFRSEEERELKWREFMDLRTESVSGVNYSTTSTNPKILRNIKEKAKEVNKFLEYGDNSGEWRKKPYNITRKMLQQIERNKRIQEMREKTLKNLEEQGALTPEMQEMLKKYEKFK